MPKVLYLKASKKTIKMEASRRVPQTKSPAKDQARVSKSAKSDLGQERFPGVPLDIFEHKQVGSALLNLVAPDEAVTGHPAPIGIANLEVASSHLSATNGASGMPNYASNLTVYQSYCLLTGSAAYPCLYTSGGNFSWGKQEEGGYERTAHCVVSMASVGQELWGVLRSDQSDNFLLSEYNKTLQLHSFPITTTVPNGKIHFRIDVGGDPGYSGEVYITDGVNVAQENFVSGITGTVNMPIPATHFEIAIVFNESLENTIVGVILTDENDNVCTSGSTPRCLGYLEYSNITHIADRAGSLRINSAELVITNCQPSIYSGGTIQCGKVVCSKASRATWVNYLYQLNKTYLANLKHGLHNLWIAQGEHWMMSTPQDFGLPYVNIGQNYSARYHNPFMDNSTAFLSVMNYANPQGGVVASLPLELKVNAWCDYTTSDTSIGTVPGIVFTDKWLTAVSVLAAAYVITDNPNHLGLRKKLKQFVQFLMSDDPRAAAIRAGGATAGKVLAGFAPLAMSMFL